MKNPKKTLQESINENRGIINKCAKLNEKRYQKEHRLSRRNSHKSVNRSPTYSNLVKIIKLTKNVKVCNGHIQHDKPERTLKFEHSYNIESLPNLPSEIFLHLF